MLPGLLVPTAGDEHTLQGLYLRQSELEIKAPFPRENLCGKQSQVALWKLIGPVTKFCCIKFPLEQLPHDYLSARQSLALKREKKVKSIMLNEVHLLKRRWDSETPSRNCQIWASKSVCCYLHAKSTGKTSKSDLLGPRQR